MKTLRLRHSTPLIIWKYISREFFMTFIVAFFFFFVMFFINQILFMARSLLQQRAPVGQVAILLVYAMPSFAALSFPFATLVSALMSVGRLTSDNEIMVMQASGISMKRIFLPFLLLGMCFAMVSFSMNDFFMPLGTINFNKAYRRIMNATPSLVLKPYSVNKFQSTTIVSGDVKENRVERVMIIDKGDGNTNRVITANLAVLENSGQGEGVISLTLDDVFVIETSQTDKARYEYSTSDRMIYNILIKDIIESTGGTAPSNMSSLDLGRIVAAKKKAFQTRLDDRAMNLARKRFSLGNAYMGKASQVDASGQNAWMAIRQEWEDADRLAREKITDKSMLSYEREYHKKFAIPFGAVFFVLLAFPVGLLFRKSGKMVGMGIGLGVSFMYWVFMYGSDTIANRLPYPPFLLMWFPNFIVLFLALLAFAIGRIRG